MAARNPQTYAKRAREIAVKERRDRKRTKKAEAAAARRAGDPPTSTDADAQRAPEDHDPRPPAPREAAGLAGGRQSRVVCASLSSPSRGDLVVRPFMAHYVLLRRFHDGRAEEAEIVEVDARLVRRGAYYPDPVIGPWVVVEPPHRVAGEALHALVIERMEA